MFLGKHCIPGKHIYVSWKKLGSRYAFSWSSGPVVLWPFQPWLLAYVAKEIILGSKKFRRNEKNMKKGSKEKQKSRTISRYIFQTIRKGRHQTVFKRELANTSVDSIQTHMQNKSKHSIIVSIVSEYRVSLSLYDSIILSYCCNITVSEDHSLIPS